jgi:hypothetical protein
VNEHEKQAGALSWDVHTTLMFPMALTMLNTALGANVTSTTTYDTSNCWRCDATDAILRETTRHNKQTEARWMKGWGVQLVEEDVRILGSVTEACVTDDSHHVAQNERG